MKKECLKELILDLVQRRVYMYAQKLLLNDDTDKQGTGTSEANKLQLQMVRVILVCMCIRTDI